MSEPWDVGKILSTTADFFSKRGIDSARLDAEVLLADTLDLSRESLLARRERRLTEIEISTYRERVRRRAGDMPVAYLVRRKEFFSLPFYVDENVLIPRPETELLVEHALPRLKSKIQNLKSKIQVCDVGTGSGCIAAAIAHARPDAAVTATERSEGAARVAVRNVADLGLITRVRIARCDLFPVDSPVRFDVIVSNPPYLSIGEFESLPATIRKFEPREALTDGKDGLTVYRRILRLAAKQLKAEGVMFLEISPRISEFFANGNLLEPTCFALTAIHPDLAGLPRIAELHFR